jgi:hypothetical protein
MTEDKLDLDHISTSIETAVTTCAPSALVSLPVLHQAVSLAKGMRALREVLTDQIMRAFMPLQGSPLGFVTDKDKDSGYDLATVRECLIQAFVMGLRPVNNEFNIIAGKCYAAKNGLVRQVREWPGLTNLQVTLSAPQMAGDKGASVAVHADWLLHGKPQSLMLDTIKNDDGSIFDTRLVIRVNGGMGPDAILGKATRKAHKAIIEKLSNGTIQIDDGDAIDTVGVVVPQAQIPEGRRMTLGEAKKPTRQPGEEP